MSDELVTPQRVRWNRFAIFALLAASACAQGIQDNGPMENDTDLGGGNTGGSIAGKGGQVSGVAGSSSSAGTSAGGTTGSAGALGASGHGGSVGTAGAANGGASGHGGTASGGASGHGGAASGGMSAGGGTSAGGKGGSAGGGAPSGGAPAGGMGGMVASGGSGGAVTSNGISIQYKVVNTNASSAYIECELHVKNAGPNTFSVSDLKARYYYTDEVKVTPQWNLNWSHVSTGGADKTLSVTQTIAQLTPATSTADSYLEFSFSSGDQSTVGPGQGLDFSWRFNGPDQAKDIYTQTNDYSFDASKTTQADWTHVVLLQNGSVIWGQTP